MKTLNDYILDAKRREERFLLESKNAYHTKLLREEKVWQVEKVLQPFSVFVTKDWREIPCANNATFEFYKREEEIGKSI